MAVFGSDPTSGFTMDPSFYGGDTTATTPGGSGFTMDPSFYGGDAGNVSSGSMPGTGLSSAAGAASFGQDVTSLLGLGGNIPGFSPAGVPAAAGSGMFLPVGCATKGTHLNKSAYWRKNPLIPGAGVRIPKHGACVKNRRRNAGNGKAAMRALSRLAMFDHLARRVEAEMSRVARRHHRPARAAAPTRAARGHRTGCRCFACRR